ncbi:MAG TPA: hypothetical protein VF821_00020 [Lentzea sp.]
MTIHDSAIRRMTNEGMVGLAVETIRRAITDTETEIAESRNDIALERARIDEDELYVRSLEERLTALRARLQQLEATS